MNNLHTAAINVASSGDTTLVPAQGTGLKVRIWAYNFLAADVVNVTLKGGSTAFTGAYPCAANTGISCPPGGRPYFESAADEAIVINLSGEVQVSGLIVYEVV